MINLLFLRKTTIKSIYIQIIMTFESKKNIFVELGNFLRQFSIDGNTKNPIVKNNDAFYEKFIDLIDLSQSHNGWFTPEHIYFSIKSWADALTEQNLTNWLNNYSIPNNEPKNIGLVLAGNIPLVGFHDFLCVILSGNKALIKTSSNDQKLLPFLVDYLISVDADFLKHIEFVDGKLENFDAVIATGSNNTARYFEYYFKNKPAIIRKNRNSVAVLTGKETKEELILLGEDIFRYFGLGCRNVSKLFVPQGYSFDLFFEAMFEYKEVIQYEKYANNYDYNKAVFLMSNYKLLDNGFLTLKEDTQQYASPISSIFYQQYDSLAQLQQQLIQDAALLQCIVSNGCIPDSIGFGQTQKPNLWDYADGIDTMEFLTKLG